MNFSIILAIFTAMVYSVAGFTFTSPPRGSTLSTDGLHSFTWTTDPAEVTFQAMSVTTGGITIVVTNVPVASGQVSFSATLPSGNNIIFQCVNAANPSQVVAQSGPVNIVNGENPLGSATSLPPNETESVFSAPAGTGSIPISTITNAVISTSVPVTELVVSSVTESLTTVSLLTTTTTLYTSPVNVTSTGTIIIPIIPTTTTPIIQNGNVPNDPFPPLVEFPFVRSPGEQSSPLQMSLQIEVVLEATTIPQVFTLPTFKKWKRVAESASIPIGAGTTVTGTRGLTVSISSSITQAATTITSSTTTSTTTPTTTPATTAATTTTTTQPAQTVTYITTAPGTIITVTATQRGNQTFYSPPAPPPITSTVFPPPYPPPPAGPSTTTTTTTIPSSGNITTVPVQPEECAICTSGLINAGLKIRGFVGWGRWEFVGWGIWIAGVTLTVWR